MSMSLRIVMLHLLLVGLVSIWAVAECRLIPRRLPKAPRIEMQEESDETEEARRFKQTVNRYCLFRCRMNQPSPTCANFCIEHHVEPIWQPEPTGTSTTGRPDHSEPAAIWFDWSTSKLEPETDRFVDLINSIYKYVDLHVHWVVFSILFHLFWFDLFTSFSLKCFSLRINS